MLLRILKQERCLSYAPTTLNSYQTLFPVNFIHQSSPYRSLCMFYKKLMNPKECL